MNLGVIYKEMGKLDQAVTSTLKSIKLKADNATAHMNLGSIYQDKGNFDAALDSTHKSIELRPNNATAHMNLGNIYKSLGKQDKALSSTLRSLELKKANPTALINLGVIYQDMGNIENALESTLEAIKIEPNNYKSLTNLGSIYGELGRHKDQKEALEKAREQNPNSLNQYIMSRNIFKKIYSCQSEISKERSDFLNTIDFIKKNPSLHFEDGLPMNMGLFWLAYHGEKDDRVLLESFRAALEKNHDLERVITKHENKNKPKREDDEIRIGIISDFWGAKHPVNLHYSKLIDQIAQSGIKMQIIVGPGVDKHQQKEVASRYKVGTTKLSERLSLNCQYIKELELDLLLYLDIGMSHHTYLLGLVRLAPLQVVMGGHPCTTGLKEIDYFVSSSVVEVKDAEIDYTERLIRLANMPSTITVSREKSSLNIGNYLDQNKISIGITHTLFKMHYKFDSILEEISRCHKNIEYILFDYPKGLKEALKQRWEDNAPLTLRRSKFFPRIEYIDFLKLLENLDIMLDPLYFGAGTVFYQCMACGLPVVTMPTRYRRTRATVSGYSQMNISNPPVAHNKEEYVSICKKLIESSHERKRLKAEIQNKATILFENKNFETEFEIFIREAVKESRLGKYLPCSWQATKQ